MRHGICFALKPGTTRDQVAAAASKAGLVLVNRTEGDGERLSYEEAWATADGAVSVHYVEDPLVNVSYLVLRDRGTHQLTASFLADLPAFGHAEALDLARQATDRNDQVRGLYRLAVMFPSFDPDAFDVFAAYATRAQTPLLREAAVDAMGYRSWPQFIPLLEQIEQQDSDAEVRQRAKVILTEARKANPGS